MTSARLLTLVWRELRTAARIPASWAVIAANVVGLALYLLIWGDGLPLVGARPVLDQFVTMQWAMLGASLPWAAARCGATRRRENITQLAALAAVPPSQIVSATLLGLTGTLAAITVSGLPFAILAQQISAVPVGQLAAAEASVLALSVFVAAITTACMLMLAQRLFAWIVASAVTLGVLMLLPSGAMGGLALLALGVSTSALLVRGADVRYRYLSERA